HSTRETRPTCAQLTHAHRTQMSLVFHSDTRLVRSSWRVKEPLSTDTTVASSMSTSAVSGPAAGDPPRSVQCSGSATVPCGPPSQMYTRPRAAFRYVRSKRMVSRWPARGWKGWVTTNESEPLLYDDAVWRDRRNTKRPCPGRQPLGCTAARPLAVGT